MSSASTYKPLEIEVTDFGPIAKARIDLRPLTVFVGPSNTGKSYLAMLIYALHRFFGGYEPNMGFNARVGASLFDRFVRAWEGEREITEDESKDLLAWMNQLFESTEEQAPLEDFQALVPDRIASLLRPLLREISALGGGLNYEVVRCFGSEGTAQLVRHGSKDGARILLKRRVSDDSRSLEPFGYTFTMQGNKTELSASIPDTTPLMIEDNNAESGHRDRIRQWISRSRSQREYLSYAEQYERHGSQLADTHQVDLVNRTAADMLRRARMHAQSRRNELAGIVGSTIFSPLERTAHFLLADRAGVMDTRTLVMASLIRRSVQMGLEQVEPNPPLSGVLADFLEKLVVLGDSSQREREVGWNLARMLEIEVLRGEVHEDQSEAGNMSFSYQALGHKERVPLMQASSMVSELAPVVLYLRHIVQPGDVLIVEEPEAHLHPGMQAVFTRQLAAVVRAGVRVMITTHSDYVLEELANLVRMSELPESQQAGLEGAEFALEPENVGVWLFEPKQRPKGTVVKEVPLDAETGLYPVGYSDVTEALYNKSVEIDNRIGETKSDYDSR